jgi:hypothetical protein
VIVLDEHLNGLGVETAIGQWYRGRVCTVLELRPSTVIKPEFKTRADRMGRVARISGDRVAYYQINDDQTYVLSLP